VLLINRAGVVVYANPAAETFFSDASLLGQFFSDVTALDRRTLNGIWRELHRARCWRGRLGLRSSGPDVEVTVQRVSDEHAASENFCVVLHGARSSSLSHAATSQAATGTNATDATTATTGTSAAHADFDGLVTMAMRGADEGEGRGKRSARSELQAALQRVASEIAHDFNNQIAVILNYTFVLLRQMPADSPLKAHVSEMQAAAWRASQVAQAIHRALVTHTTHALLPSSE
jgi:signal transduction histidine kinase